VKKKPTSGRARVDRLTQDDEIKAQRLKLPREACQVMDATGQPIELHAGNNIDHPPARIKHEAIKRGAPIFGTANALVEVLTCYLQAAGLGIRAQRMKLRLDVLLGGGDTGVEGNSGHPGFLFS